MMQRLLVWFMTGVACFTLAVAIIGLDSGPSLPTWLPPPRRVAFAFMALGSTIILAGVIVEAVVTFLRLLFGARGRCVRAIHRRIRIGQQLLRQPALSRYDFGKWQDDSEAILARHLGGLWHPEFREFEDGKARHLQQPDQDLPKVQLARQLERLGVTIEYVRSPGSLVMPDRTMPKPR